MRRIEPPILIATLFRVVGPSARPIRCATSRVLTGIELRCEYEAPEDDVLRSHLFVVNWDRTDGSEQHDAIATMAAQWRAAFDGRGFNNLPVT